MKKLALAMLLVCGIAIAALLTVLLFMSTRNASSDEIRVFYNKKATEFLWCLEKATPFLPISMADQFTENPSVKIDAQNLRLEIDLGSQDINLADSETTDFVKAFAGTVYIPLVLIDGTVHFPLNTAHQFFGVDYSISGNSLYIVDNVEISGISPSATFVAPQKSKWLGTGSMVNLAWQYVNQETPEAPPKYDGLDILSPTWFHLITDGDGNISNNGDKGYTDLCHERGYMVWATVTNSMTVPGSTKFTTKVLSTPFLLNKAIAQYVFYACLYDVDGINIDFEDVDDGDAEGLVNFTRTMREYTERQGLALSIDTLIPKPWTIEYDRKNLAKHVDYIAVMTYDEHWSTSPKPGSVSSLPWVEQAIKDTLREVPANKVLMGVPLYTRVWCVNERGKITSHKAATMSFVQNLLAEESLVPEYLENEQQNYVEYKDGDDTAMIWIEDEVSIQNRINLAIKYSLAGTACWQFSQATSDIWQLFAFNN